MTIISAMTRSSADNDKDRLATQWVIRRDRGLTDAERRELDQWLRVDRRHVGAFARAQAAWAVAADRHIRVPEPDIVPARRRLLAGGGALAACLALGITGWRVLGPEQYRTAMGEVRRILLADGSVVTLNTDSAIAVDLGRKERRIDLDRGEAWFSVAADASRPFIVQAGLTRVDAPVSEFTLRRQEERADLMVTGGQVRTWVEGTAAPIPTLVTSGHRLSRDGDGNAAMASLSAQEARRRLAWREGMIILEGETLAAAAADFNRYNHRRIIITDPLLARQKMVGAFRAEDPESFARAAGVALGAPVAVGPDQIRIGSARSA